MTWPMRCTDMNRIESFLSRYDKISRSTRKMGRMTRKYYQSRKHSTRRQPSRAVGLPSERQPSRASKHLLSTRPTHIRNFESLSILRNIGSPLKSEKALKSRKLYEKARWEALFRTPSALQTMLARDPHRIGNLPARLFLLSCHGCIDRKKIMRVPRHIAAFDLAEGDYRGYVSLCILDRQLFNVMIGSYGANIGNFFNAMMGGEHRDDPRHIIPQIGYRAPGDLMFDFNLEIRSSDSNNFSATHGCWDITDTVISFDPEAFSYKSPRTNQYVDPNKRREITRYGQPPHEVIPSVNRLLMREGGAYISDVFDKLQQLHPSTVCFVFISTCANICGPEPKGAAIPSQPSARTHHALDRSAIGVPSARPESMFGRNMGHVPFPGTA